MKRIKNFFVSLAVMAFTHTIYAIAFGLRQVVKFAGLDPDVSPYQKHLAHLTVALNQNHESPYDQDFDTKKYVKRDDRFDRPSFKFKKPESSLKVTENPATQELFTLANKFVAERKVEAPRPKLKDLVTQIQKAGESVPKRVAKPRAKTKKIVKKTTKKAA